MQNFQIEIAAMQQARTQLARYRDALEQYRQLAAGLPESVPKSVTGVRDPVADKLHQVYSDRAHTDGGVQGALQHYLTELDKIQSIIDVSLGAYSAADQGAASQYRSVPGETR